MKNIAPPRYASINHPPRNGPIARHAAEPDQAPIAAPRTSTRKDAEIIERLPGTRSAAAAPWTNAGGDQGDDVRRQAAQQRGRGERDEAVDEHLAPAEAVAERSAEHEERAQGEQVAVEHPLQTGEVGVEVLGDRRQRGVDDAAVEEHDARPEHGGAITQRPAAVPMRSGPARGRN